MTEASILVVVIFSHLVRIMFKPDSLYTGFGFGTIGGIILIGTGELVLFDCLSVKVSLSLLTELDP